MEIFDVVDEFGEPTGETVDRETAHLEGVRHRTSHLWLLRKKGGKTEILLQKRSQNKSFPGCYDISSAGHIPAGDDFRESAIRELREELGITAEESDLKYCGDKYIVWDDEFFGKPYHDRQYTRVFLMWLDLDEDEFTLQAEEVDDVLWMDLEQCIEGVCKNSFRNCIDIDELRMVKRTAQNHYVYILRCADGTFYTGYTTDPERRTRVHNSGKGAKYTRARRPVELIYTEEYNDKREAQRREYAIKQLTRTEKENLIKSGKQ